MVTAALPLPNDRPPHLGSESDHDPSGNTPYGLDDAALAAAMVAGDGSALDQLYVRYRAIAFATAYALLRDVCAAEDVVQDAFVRVWRGAAAYQPSRGSLRAWLLTIVRNTAIDQLRARGIAMRHQPRLIHHVSRSDDGDDVSLAVTAAVDARRLHDAMGMLPPEQRHALELAFFGGLTHGEIAARTGAPLGTVKGRVRLGLRRLRQDLADLAPTTATASRLSAHAA